MTKHMQGDDSEGCGLDRKVTQVYWQPLAELLSPAGAKVQSLNGFDDEFIDITDYIIRITHRIWEQKNIGLCHRYYADYCPVHTLGSYSDDVDTVIKNTLRTIAAFPDRSLLGENVVWRDLGDAGYYSSHRITSIMTNKGASEFGAATGKTGRVTTIADCICKDNKIVYEWLMRDNSFLIKQLGIDLIDAAEYMAQFQPHQNFKHWLTNEQARVEQGSPTEHQWPTRINTQYADFAKAWVDQFFNQKAFSELKTFYAMDASVQWPGGRQVVGLPGISGTFIQWLAQCPDAKATCDHIAVTAFNGDADDDSSEEDAVDIAIRWSLVGTYHANTARLSKFNGQTFFVLGASHMRIRNGLISQEWTVFDEVAALANLFREYQQRQLLEGGYQGA